MNQQRFPIVPSLLNAPGLAHIQQLRFDALLQKERFGSFVVWCFGQVQQNGKICERIEPLIDRSILGICEVKG